MSQALVALRKDALLQWRTRGRFVAVFVFGATALLLFSFAIGPNAGALRAHAAGFLWLALLLASTLALADSFHGEMEHRALEGLSSCPRRRSASTTARRWPTGRSSRSSASPSSRSWSSSTTRPRAAPLAARRPHPPRHRRPLRAGHALRGHDRAGARQPDPAAPAAVPAGRAGAAGGGEGDLAGDDRRSHGPAAVLDAAAGLLRPHLLRRSAACSSAAWWRADGDRRARRDATSESNTPYLLAGAGIVLLVVGSYWGLFYAPRETYMGDVQRIMYVHVPTAWNAMLAFTFAFVCAVASLLRGGYKWDARLEAAMEVGRRPRVAALHPGLDLGQADLGRVVGLGPAAHHHRGARASPSPGSSPCAASWTIPQRRAVWSAVATIVAYVDVPIVYFSVQVVELAAPDAVDAGDGLARRSTGRCASTPSASSS